MTACVEIKSTACPEGTAERDGACQPLEACPPGESCENERLTTPRPPETHVSLVGGGGLKETSRFRLRLNVGAAEPVGQNATAQRALTVGPGVLK